MAYFVQPPIIIPFTSHIRSTHGGNGVDVSDLFQGSTKAVGIEIDDAIAFETPIPLKEIKKTSPKFSPPQTFKYLSKECRRDAAYHHPSAKNL